jgi:hypothetical protein
MGDKERKLHGSGPIERHRPLMELATTQHGVVSTRQLAGLGYTRSSASKANGVGRLHRLHRGVYAVGHRDLTWHSRCMAAVLACAPAVASYLSAGWLWGLLRWRPETQHLTVPTTRHPKRQFVVHTAVLPPQDLDYDLLSRAAHHPGAAKLRAALDIYRPQTAFTRSGLERRFLELVTAAGLPVPAMNFNVGAYELDAYWEAERFGVELDVYETHGSHAAFETDRRREDDLLLLGVETIRVTGPRLGREPRETVERVAAHLERRRRPGVRLD